MSKPKPNFFLTRLLPKILVKKAMPPRQSIRVLSKSSLACFTAGFVVARTLTRVTSNQGSSENTSGTTPDRYIATFALSASPRTNTSTDTCGLRIPMKPVEPKSPGRYPSARWPGASTRRAATTFPDTWRRCTRWSRSRRRGRAKGNDSVFGFLFFTTHSFWFMMLRFLCNFVLLAASCFPLPLFIP